MSCANCVKRFSCPFDQNAGGNIFENTEKEYEHKFISFTPSAEDVYGLSCVEQKKYKFNSEVNCLSFNPSTEEFGKYLKGLCKIIMESTDEVER
jgi:hypothetical protein